MTATTYLGLPIPPNVVGFRPSVEEETPMTFQVVMHGTNGVIVGSDRRRGIKTAESEYGELQYEPACKFVTSDDESIICATSGGPRASSIAREIAIKANPKEPSGLRWVNSLSEIADSIPYDFVRGEVIVVRRHIHDVMLISYGQSTANLTEINQSICTGIAAPSRFLVEHFWRLAPVEELQSLVLLALDYAAREKPGEVGFGFDIKTIKSEGISSETYAPDDERITAIRTPFESAVRSVIYREMNAA
jgi:hypothetical protein